MVKKKAVKVSKAVKTSNSYDRMGQLAFFAGLIVAIAAGLVTKLLSEVALMSTLFLLGLIVGALNIRIKETTPFLIATATLILAGVINLSLIPVIGVYIRAILTNIVVFVVPAAVLVALRAVWMLAEKR